MATLPSSRISSEEYLENERKAQTKSEYFRGESFAMGCSNVRHVLIVTNLVGELSQKLRQRPCKVYSTDLRLKVSPAGLYTYPDVMVTCGEEKYDDEHADTLLNPSLIIEVLSESTKNYDRGQKFETYRTLPSLMEYLTIGQDEVHVEQWVRQPDQRWVLTEYNSPAAAIALQSVSVQLQV